MKRLRHNMFLLGIDTSDLTDEQIELAILLLGDTVRSIGISSQEFAESIARLANTIAYHDLNHV